MRQVSRPTHTPRGTRGIIIFGPQEDRFIARGFKILTVGSLGLAGYVGYWYGRSMERVSTKDDESCIDLRNPPD
jgi:hypothetical protein